MFVAIEGMDGVGKTTISKKVAKLLDMEYIEKPMQKFLNLPDDEYNDLCNKIWSSSNPNITPWFFCLGNIVTRDFSEDVIVDRHILSTYFWDFNESNKSVFDAMLENNVIPDITIILHSSIETRLARIRKRNKDDEDLEQTKTLEYGYDKLVKFAKELKIPYVVVDTENMSIDEVTKRATEIIYLTKKAIEEDKELKIIRDYYNDEFSISNLTNNSKKHPLHTCCGKGEVEIDALIK